MHKGISCILLVIITLTAGCVAGTKIRTKPNPDDPIAQYPKLCVGDTVVTVAYSSTVGKDTFTSKITRVNKDGSFETTVTTEKDNRKEQLQYNNNYRLVNSTNLHTGEAKIINTPPAKRLDFPLFVGKRWTDSYKGSSVKGRSLRYSNTYTVVDYQKINIKAEEFDVFKIWRITKNESSTYDNSFEEVYYYSPKIKSVIKTDPSWRNGSTLTDYEIKNCN